MLDKIEEIQARPHHLGLYFQGDEAHFALYSEHANQVFLGLFGEREREFALHRSGPIWHIALKGVPRGIEYAYRCEGRYGWLCDPYAKILSSPATWRGEGSHVRAKALPVPEFDWQGVTQPHIPLQDLVIYEMHVRGFTKHASSGVKHPGTYLGVIEKIPYLKELGINAVELLPVFEFDETHVRPGAECNYWGYNPIQFFAPMRRFAYGSELEAPIQEFRTMVRELHRNGILVILDVVYNHTGEGKEEDYAVCFRGIDKAVYYMDKDYTGCGNTFNTNHPVVMQLILESLHYWVEEMHVDGFRFDLASVFTRHPESPSPILQAIAKDPVLAKVKLIAEPWDAGGLYQVGLFPHFGPWSEWNGQYRDTVRRFIKGTDGQAGLFANALCGSQSIYPETPLSSVNFITAHDGFSLRDQVSYQQKHNLANGEMNQDGANDNYSWNCGEEGPTENPQIQALRERQIRNFLLALFISQGIPMLVMGDEYGHTRNGNNNPYVQDNELNWFLWDKRDSLFEFVQQLIDFRKRHSVLRSTRFLKDSEVEWHNPWDPHTRFVSYTLHKKIFVAFNAHFHPAQIALPPGGWRPIIQTAPGSSLQELPPHSAILLEKIH